VPRSAGCARREVMPAQHRAVNRTGDQAGNPAGNPEPAPEAQSSASLSLRPPMNASCDSSDALCVVPAAWCLLRSAASAAYYVVPAVLRLCGECCVLRAACCVLRTAGACCVLRTAWCVVRLRAWVSPALADRLHLSAAERSPSERGWRWSHIYRHVCFGEACIQLSGLTLISTK